MTLTGYLSAYSLAEIFNFVDREKRTGLLSILPDNSTLVIAIKLHYLWFENGRIMAVTIGLEGQELLDAIGHRKLIPTRELDLLRTQSNQLAQPLGIYLRSRGLLNLEQLKLLFNSQV